ncbi:MAG: hypothetical protein ACRDIX_06925, partial [Actinomycetota bacterium]
MRRVLSLVAALGLAIGSGWLVARAYYWGFEGEAVTAATELPSTARPLSSGPEEVPSDVVPLLLAFAVAGGVRLRLPAVRPVALAYHEASMPRRFALHPLGSCLVCRNRGKFRPPRVGPSELEYMVMDTRGRAAAATSAVDVVVRRWHRVRAPVTGRVWSVRHYRLYGRYPDVRVAIVPDGRSDRLVVLIHLRDPRV